MRNSAFSLIEISIVLVIIGLLTGGIMAGQSLIRASQLRGVVSEFNAYHTAVLTFKQKYFALPGDMNNATDFWGAAHPDPITCRTSVGTGTQTCNGNGSGLIADAEPNEYGENFMFWQHLANAGLISGNYTGIAGPGGDEDSNYDNSPVSKVDEVLWYIEYFSDKLGSWEEFDGTYGNGFLLGRIDPGWKPDGKFLNPKEAWNIDKKIDDGIPAIGRVRPEDRVDCTVKANDSPQTSAAGDAALLDSKYNLQEDDIVCTLYFLPKY